MKPKTKKKIQKELDKIAALHANHDCATEVIVQRIKEIIDEEEE